jgi:hypothetical protein
LPWRWLLLLLLPAHEPPGIFLTVRLAADLEVAVPQRHAAPGALKAADMVLDARLGVLQVLALDPAAAAAAERAVQLVVVQLAVGLVV